MTSTQPASVATARATAQVRWPKATGPPSAAVSVSSADWVEPMLGTPRPNRHTRSMTAGDQNMPKDNTEEVALPPDSGGTQAEDVGKSPDIIDELDLDNFRVDESMLVAAARDQVSVPVDKPKGFFFRVHPTEALIVSLLKDPDGRFLLVSAVVANDPLMAGYVAPYKLVLVIDRSGNLYLWPLRQVRMGETSYAAWESSAAIAEAAKRIWLRMQWNKSLSAYDRYDAPFQPPEPQWPTRSIGDIVKVAFAGRVVASLEHPVVQQLLGRV